MENNKQRKLRKGLTLVEIVAVIALIAIISLVAVNAFRNLNEGARVSSLDVSHDALVTAARMYQAVNGGSVPANRAALGPFLEGVPNTGATDAQIDDLIVRIGANTPNVTAVDFTWAAGVLTIQSTIAGLERNHGHRVGEQPTGTAVYTRTTVIG